MDARTSALGERDGAGRPSSTGPTAPSVVARLGPYRLLQVIGGGGMGVVHLGLDPAGRAVAIKVLRPHVAAEPSARSRLAREVDALQRVRSPRVAEVLDADPDAEQPYLVTEFVPAPSLDVLVEQEGPLRGAALGRLGLGLGDALAAIHAAGVVHRDLKPGNVLVADGDPVVIDFGIAQLADDVRLTSAGLVMGTPGYLSPEVLDGGSAVVASSDWWGWAATLAFAATGRAPFGAGPQEAVLSRVRRGAADLVGAPEELSAVLAAALSPDPARRPPPPKLRQAVQVLVDGGSDGWPPARTPSSSARTTALPVRTSHDDATRPAVVPPPPAPPAPAAARGAAQPADRATVQLPEVAAPIGDAPPEAAPVPWPEPPRRAAAAPAAPTASAAETVVNPVVPAATAPGPAPSLERTRALPADDPRSEERTRVIAPPAEPAPEPAPVFSARQHDRAPAPSYGPPHDASREPSPYEPPRDAQREASPYDPAPPSPRARPATGAVLLLLLLVGVALGAVAPLVAAMAVAVAAVVARTVDRAVAAAVRRRYERGPRRSDGAVVAVALPGQLLLAVLTSVPALLLPAAMAVSTAFLVGWAIAPQSTPVPGQALPLAAAIAVGTATSWWGPGGRSVRRGSRTAVRGALPGRTGSLVAVAVLALLLLACVLVVVSAGGVPDWTPLTSPPPGLG